MDSNVERRLNRIEGLLTKLLIDSKVSEKTADKALDLATSALIEIRSFKESTHETKVVNGDVYSQMFETKEVKDETYGPTVEYPFSLRDDTSIFDFNEDELNEQLSGPKESN